MPSALIKIAVFWLLLTLLAVGGSHYLIGLADAMDKGNLLYYEHPTWSEDESQVAFMRYESAKVPTPAEAQSLPRALCRVSRTDETPLKIADLGTEPYRLLGWINEDQSLLLQPLKDEGVPRVLLVSLNGKQQEIRFEKEGLQLVGVQGGQLFFQRVTRGNRWDAPGSREELTPTPSPSASPTPSAPPGLTRDEVALLAWTPGQNSVTRLLGIPLEGEKISIAAAYPSPDGTWVAIVLKVGDEQALWLYNRHEDHLGWTHIKVPTNDMQVAWAPDSAGLVCAVQAAEGSELYAMWSVASGRYTRLRSRSAGKNYRPFWPRGEKYFLLLDESGIYRFDPENLRAERLLGRYQQGHRAEELTVSPRASWAVYHSREDGQDNLYYLSMKTRQVRSLLPPPARETHNTETWYVVADGLRTALGYWKGEF